MPIYEYTCEKCDKDFELLVRGAERPQCPECQNPQLVRRLSVISTPATGQTAQGPVCDPLPGGG